MLGRQSRWLSAAAFAGAWTLVALVFAALSHAIAISNGMRPNTGVTVGQHLLRFYIWAALSLLIFRFARKYSLGPRETRARRLLLHLPALLAFSLAHVITLTAVLWSSGLFTAAQMPRDVFAYYRLTFFGSLYSALIQCALVF